MKQMFSGCTKFNGDLKVWNVGNVVDMQEMFFGCTGFSFGDAPRQDTKKQVNWNVGNVFNMQQMFAFCTNFNSRIATWNVSNVTKMYQMFDGCKEFNCGEDSGYAVPGDDEMGSIGMWDTSKVTNMEAMFRNCESFNQDLSNWDVSNSNYLERMFEGCALFNPAKPLKWTFNTPLDGDVINLSYMFKNCQYFNQDLIGWDLKNIQKCLNMFEGCKNFNGNITDWKLPAVVEGNFKPTKALRLDFMFKDCENFNQDISKWDVSNVYTMQGMFEGCKKFNCGAVPGKEVKRDDDKFNLGNWTVTQVGGFGTLLEGVGIVAWNRVFFGCEEFNQDLTKWENNYGAWQAIGGVDAGTSPPGIDMFTGASKMTLEKLPAFMKKPESKADDSLAI